MARLVVVGGGIAGLAAAWSAADAARQAGVNLEVLVLERGQDVGGKARTIQRDGWLVEGGPSGFLSGRPEMDRLVAASGLDKEIVFARESAKRRFLFCAGKLSEIRPSPVALARSGILSAAGFLRLAVEPFVPRAKPSEVDETVWQFAARRLGAEAADRLVAPMTLGIFAGDARRLSLVSAFPKMAALEREHGSLIRGLIVKRGKTSTGRLTSFRDGMQSLPRALAALRTFSVRCNSTVTTLQRTGNGWAVSIEGSPDPIATDAVILATEPWVSSRLLRPLHQAAADALANIPCPAVAVAALGYGTEARARVPDGFGVLIARDNGFRMLGNLWETSIYPARGPDGGILIRAMLGGAVDASIGDMSDEAVLALARDEVRRLYGLTIEPRFTEIVRVPRAIPQYEVGHRERVAVVESAVSALPALAITGFGLRGVAFPDAAADGVRTGEAIAARLGAPSG